MKQHRICALCRHLELLEQGREFPQIADTEYAVFRCKLFGWTTRDDYLMDSEPARRFQAQEEFDCERWEGWSPEETGR